MIKGHIYYPDAGGEENSNKMNKCASRDDRVSHFYLDEWIPFLSLCNATELGRFFVLHRLQMTRHDPRVVV
jgi:hypothetical protein